MELLSEIRASLPFLSQDRQHLARLWVGSPLKSSSSSHQQLDSSAEATLDSRIASNTHLVVAALDRALEANAAVVAKLRSVNVAPGATNVFTGY